MPDPVTEAATAQPLHERWLLGQPPLSRLLNFVDDANPPGNSVDRIALVDAWRSAGELFKQLEQTQAGIANEGTHRELGGAESARVDALREHAGFRTSFDTLPTRVAMVELDKLILCQMHVTEDFVERLKARLGPTPTADAVFETCLPHGHPGAPVKVRKVGSRRYVFQCDSTDFRFHDAALLSPQQLGGLDSFGPVASAVALMVGFGTNFLNVVQVGRRMLLNNGYHRAVALRALGVTHVPAIVQTANTIDELEVTVKSRVADDPSYYFESARPPLLQDFFDPRLYRLIPVRKRTRLIELSFEVKDNLVAE